MKNIITINYLQRQIRRVEEKISKKMGTVKLEVGNLVRGIVLSGMKSCIWVV
ncbi:MAG: hypothetical protein ACRDFB_03080 [Rhabdochlamydiaceae bacterium]